LPPLREEAKVKVKRSAEASAAAASLISILVFAPGRSDAQENPPAVGAKLSEVTWSKAGTYQWNRPDHVRFVLVRACGGGGGGGGGYSILPRPVPRQDAGTATGGGGGAGAVVSTILLGPLTDSTYTIAIGHGGKGAVSTHRNTSAQGGISGEAGGATSFTGADIAFETPGAAGGNAGRFSSRMSDDATSYRYVVTKAGSSGTGYSGGGSAQAGARGLLGRGGAGSAGGDSGGGGGSVGNGGAGGAQNSDGIQGGICAGGGGAGFIDDDRNTAAGGSGGDGSLTLLSLATEPNAR
jgi:hypothetical protein